MNQTTNVLLKLKESGPEALNHSELIFAKIIQVSSVCKECHNNIHALDKDNKRVCPICSGKEFEEIEIDTREYKCSDCRTPAYPNFYQTWTDLPFINTKNKTFYCGCRGWD